MLDKLFSDTDWIKREYIIALLGSELDEYNEPYVNVYKWELKEFMDNFLKDIDYIRGLNFSLSERYDYYRSLLIQSGKNLVSDVREINIEYMDELAFKIAKEIY